MFWTSENIDILREVRKELLCVSKAYISLVALMVELDCQLFQVDIKLHVLQQVFAYLVNQ